MANRFTKDYLQVINNLQNQAGACYGYDGVKAVIYGEGKLEQEKDFKEILKKCSAVSVSGIAVNTIGYTILGTLAPLLAPFLGSAALVYYLVNRSAKAKKLRQEQTNAALILFLAECFDVLPAPDQRTQALQKFNHYLPVRHQVLFSDHSEKEAGDSRHC